MPVDTFETGTLETSVKGLIRAITSNRGRTMVYLAMFALLALTFAGCDTDTPQNTFDTKGEVADRQADMFYLAMWPAIVVMIGVLGGIVLIGLRYRERDPNQPPPRQVHGNTRLEVAWTIAPAILLLIIGIPMVQLIGDLDAEAGDDAYTIDVIGQRYSWVFEYPEELDSEGNPLLVFDGVAHIPVGQKVNFRLRSIDVIHSFWMPKLGGKRDVFPCKVANVEEEKADPLADPKCEGGQLNTLWLVADEAGSFSGQCAEYCGLEHANMRLTVIADEEDDFQAWVQEAGGGSNEPEEASPEAEETASPEALETASPVAEETASPEAEETASPEAEETASPVAEETASPEAEETPEATEGEGG